jgi:hypothetical protein
MQEKAQVRVILFAYIKKKTVTLQPKKERVNN